MTRSRQRCHLPPPSENAWQARNRNGSGEILQVWTQHERVERDRNGTGTRTGTGVNTALDKGTAPINVYLDLSKAFDTLDHNIVLHELKYYGIEGTALRLFESYLNERQQYVDLDGTTSSNNRILTGVPQGPILGHLPFIIYINDIAQSSKHFNVIIYADDTTLCSTLKINTDATQLNMELNNVSQWLNLNKLSLNVKKYKSNGFSYSTKQNNTTKYTNQWV